MDGQKGILGQAYEANLRARGVVSEPSDTASTYLRNVGIDPNVDTRTPVEKWLSGLNYYTPPTQLNAPPPPAGSDPTKPTGTDPTVWEYGAAVGESALSNFAGTIDNIQVAIPRTVHDFILNYNVPLWEGDDEYRKEADVVAQSEFAGDKTKAQNAMWDRKGRKLFEEIRSRSYSGLLGGLGLADLALGSPVGKLINDGQMYAKDTLALRLQNRSPEVQQWWVTELAGILGGSAPYVALAFIPGGYGVAAGGLAAGVAQYNDAYTQAREKGASFLDALQGGGIASVPALATAGITTKFVVGQKVGAGLARMADSWNKASGGKFEKMMDALNKYAVGRIGTAGAAEAMQEMIEQLFVNFGVAYATDADLLELENYAKDMAGSGEGGAQAGVFFRTLTEVIAKKRAAGHKELSPKVGDTPVLDEETGEVRSLTKLTPDQAARIAGSIPTSLTGGIEPEPQRYIDAQFSAMMNPENRKVAVFVAEKSPQPSSALTSAAKGLQAIKIPYKGVVYTLNSRVADVLREMSATPEGVPDQALDALLYGMEKGKPKNPDSVVVRIKDKEGNVLLSRVTEPSDIAKVKAKFKQQIPSGLLDVVTPAEELTERIEARKPDIKQQTIADEYFDQALNEKNLPRDVPINELAAIIAAEKKIDIGIATAVARNVRGRLDQGVPVEPQYAKIVTIDPTDPNTWPKDVLTQEQATELLRSQQRDYLDQYSAYQAASGPTPEETAQQRLEGMVGGPEAEAQRAARTKEIRAAAKASAERERKDSDRAVGESYRKYQEELRDADRRAQATVLAYERSKDPTEREIASAYRELYEQYRLNPEAREADQQQLEEDYQGLVEKLSKAEADATAGIAAEVKRRADEKKLTERQAKELQALLLPEAETKARKDLLQQLKNRIKLDAKQKAGAPKQTEDALAFEELIAEAVPALVAERDAALAEAKKQEAVANELDAKADELQAEIEDARKNHQESMKGVKVPLDFGKPWIEVAKQLQAEKEDTVRRYGQAKAAQIEAELTARKKLEEIQTLQQQGEVDVGQPEPLAATQNQPASEIAAKGKYSITPEQAGVALATSMPSVYGGANVARNNFLKRMLQVVASTPNGVTIDTLVNNAPRQKDVDVGQRREQVLENLALMEGAGLLVAVPGDRPTYALSLEAAQQLGQTLEAAKPTGEATSFGRARTAEGAAIPKAGASAEVGKPPPGKTAYEYRLDAALTADPYVNLQMSAPDVRLEAGPALDKTAEHLAAATNEQLQVMINSQIPVGLEGEAVETWVNPATGIPTVTKVQPKVVALPKKTTSLATWIAHRTLAQGELRRRAAATARKNDAARSARAADNLRRDSAFGKPRMSYDSLRGAETTLGERKGQPIIEMGDAPGFEGASLTGTLQPTLDNPPTKPVTKLDLRDAMMDLASAVVAPLVTTDMSGTPYVGRFDVEGVIRTASTFNFHVTGHEIGHALTARVFGEGLEGVKALDAAMPPAARAEMERLGKLVYPDATPPTGGHMHEGMAEFVMGSIIRPEAYNSSYPATARWLAELMQQNPDIGKAYDKAVAQFTAYRFQGFEKVGQAAQVQRGSKPWLQRVKEVLTLSFFEREFVNAMMGTRKLQNQAIKNGKKAGLSKNQLDRLRVNDMNEALAAVNANLLQTWMSVGMTDGNGNIKPGSQSLEMALAPMRRAAKGMKDADISKDFGDYLYAKRALALFESERATVSPDGVNTQRANIARLESKYGDAIKLAHGQFMAWWGHAIDYVKANDPLFAQVFDSIAKYEEATGTTGTYVPLQRVIYDMATGQSADTGLAAVFDVRRAGEGTVSISGRGTEGKLVGSSSPTYNVLQESEASLQALLTLVHKRMAIRNVINVSQSMRLPGYVIELTDVDGAMPEPASTASGKAAASLIDVGDSATIAALRDMGLNAAQDVNSSDRVIVDYADVRDVTVTTPDGRTEVIKQPVKRRYSMHKDVAIAVAAMKPQEVMQAWRSHWALGAMQGLASAFKLGATSLNIGFQLMSAPIMDFGTTYMNGTQPWCGLKMLIDYPLTYLRLAAAEVGVKYEPYEQYKRMAGSFDSPWSATMSKSSIQYVMMSRGQRVKSLLTLPNIVKPNGDLWRLAERKLSFGSRVGRMLEMQQALKQAGYTGEGPISQQQMVAATVALRRVTTNWSVSGRTAGELNRYIPYFNVTFVTTRDFFRNAAKQMGDPRTRIQYGIKMAGLMGMAMAYWAMAHDDEDPAMKEAYENASYEDRMRYWIFGYKTEDGTTEVLRVPNPMTEFLPAKLLVAALDGVNSRDPYYAANQAKAFINAFMPSLMPQFVQSGLENAWNVNDLNKWAIDKGFTALRIESNEMHAPIEPEIDKGPRQERVTPYTTEAGILVSEVLNGVTTPRQADHIIEGFIGGASDTLATLLRIQGPMTPEAVKQAPGYGSMPTELTVGRLVSKAGPITMRSPKIQELAMMYEMAQNRKDSTRTPETAKDYYELAALRDAWGCVSALHYISQYHETMPRADRQRLMQKALEIAEDVTGKMQRQALAIEYKTYDMSAKQLKMARGVIQEQQLSKTPGYKPSIDWGKILR